MVENRGINFITLGIIWKSLCVSQQTQSGLESTVKQLEAENSSLQERCGLLEVDSTSRGSELAQLLTNQRRLESDLASITDERNSLVADKSQV